MAREKVEFDVIGRDAGGSKVFKEVGDAADKAGEKVDGVGEKFHGLDAEIEQTRTHMRNLAKEIDETGNKDLFKDLRKQQSELRRLMSVKNLLGDGKDNDQDAVKVGLRFGEKLGEGLGQALAGTRLGPMIGPPLITGAVAAAPFLSSVISGAITAGVGAGVVAAGVAVAAKDQRVKDAATQLGQDFSAGMSSAASSFVPATIKAIDTIRREFRSLLPDIKGLFETAAPYVEPLTRAVTGFVREIIPGLQEATRNARPLMDMLADEGPRAASAFGTSLRLLSQDADHSAAALHGLFTTVEGATVGTAGLISLLNKLGGSLDTTAQSLLAITPLGTVLGAPLTLLGKLGDKLTDTGTVIGRRVGDMDNMAHASKDAAGGIRELTESYGDMMARFAGENLSAREAQRGLEEAIDRATGALKENGRTLDINTPKGRANQEALDGIAEAANRTYASTLRQTGSQVAATEAAQRGRGEFIRLAHSMGLSWTEATRLADGLIGIPSETPANVKSNAKTVAEQAAAVDRKLRDIENGSPYNAQVNVRFTEKGDRFGISGKAFKGQSHGGRVEGPGTDTSDDIIRRVSRGEYIIRAAAARAIGYDTLDALNQADRRPVAMTSAGSTSTAPVHGITAEDFYRAMVRAIQTLPIVRLDAGRTAGIYARGG